ncbi:MAG: hypothetical protein JWM27_1494 [Gemmatimonadetes bacterium]|nr:hypothetical protein [Gemmatimonadota bacterium]
MTRSKFRKLVLPVAGLALLAGCARDDESIKTLTGPQYAPALFTRYVSLGNSITSGYQASGISGATQAQAYPVLLAQAANAPFTYPVLAGRGCAPPLAGPFLYTAARLGTTGVADPTATAATCDLRSSAFPRFVQNLAVPGAKIDDALTNFAIGTSANALTTFFLGGRSQVQAMVALQPSLVSVFLGNNDALGAAVAGDTAQLTSLPAFQQRVDSLVAALKTVPAGQGGNDHDVVLIGIAPFPAIVQPGAYAFVSRDAAGNLGGKAVSADCAPGTPGGSNLVSLAILGSALPAISCADNAPYVLNATERTTFFSRIDAYNAALSKAASDNGWIYINTNAVLGGAGTLAGTLRAKLSPTQFRLCQGLATAATPAAIQAAVLTTCPSPTLVSGAIPPYTVGSAAYANFFGTWLTFDAVHPSLPFHKLLTNAMIDAINTKHGTTIPNIS